MPVGPASRPIDTGLVRIVRVAHDDRHGDGNRLHRLAQTLMVEPQTAHQAAQVHSSTDARISALAASMAANGTSTAAKRHDRLRSASSGDRRADQTGDSRHRTAEPQHLAQCLTRVGGRHRTLIARSIRCGARCTSWDSCRTRMSTAPVVLGVGAGGWGLPGSGSRCREYELRENRNRRHRTGECLVGLQEMGAYRRGVRRSGTPPGRPFRIERGHRQLFARGEQFAGSNRPRPAAACARGSADRTPGRPPNSGYPFPSGNPPPAGAAGAASGYPTRARRPVGPSPVRSRRSRAC